jgi:hypothetical protein
VANILQVAYYRGPLLTRARRLESRGHHVTSVLGNDEAFGLDAAVIAAADSIVIGFSAPYPVRAAMIRWFKQLYPNIPLSQSSPCDFTAPRAFPRPMAALCPTTLRFGWRRSREPSKNQGKRLRKCTITRSVEISGRPDVNIYPFASAAVRAAELRCRCSGGRPVRHVFVSQLAI